MAASRDVFAKVAADVVIHMIAYTEAQARGFAETFEGIAGRAVVISSMDVYRIYDRLRRLERGAMGEEHCADDELGGKNCNRN